MFIITIITMQSALVLYDFKKEGNPGGWTVVNDVVMGGRSDAYIKMNREGNAVFSGHVSLENNGGFASVRLRLSPVDVSGFKTLVLRVRGASERYQMRCKTNWGDPQSYIAWFDTSGQWQEVRILLKEMVPTFRGSRLDMPDYPAEELSEIAILIGNKKEQDFSLEIERIWLE